MFKIELQGRAGFDRSVADWIAAVTQTAESVTKGLVFKLLDTILYKGPQYSGDFVANWNVSIGSTNYQFVPGGEVEAAFIRYERGYNVPAREGDRRAIQKALDRINLAGFKLGQTIYLANASAHDESYAVLIEQNRIEFRPENPSGGRVVARAMLNVGASYRTMDRATALRLAMVGV